MSKPKSFAEWLNKIQLLSGRDIDLGITKLQPIVDFLTVPDQTLVITVGGTNGKGTAAHLLATIYQKAGYSVALYTSPHLHCFRERLQVNGLQLSEQQWIKSFEWLESIRDDMPLTFFEYTTFAAAKMAFDAQPNVMIFEVGLGGLHDMVNCFDADLSLVTSIDLDHTEFLGSTRSEIAVQKAGIFRQNKPAVYAGFNMPTSMSDCANAMATTLYIRGEDFIFEKNDDQGWLWRFKNQRVLIPRTHYSDSSIAGALQAIALLQEQRPVPLQDLYDGLRLFKLPGRFECMNFGQSQVVFDVAHNPAASARLLQNLLHFFPDKKFHFIVAFAKNKDAKGCLEQLVKVSKEWTFFELTDRPSYTISELKHCLYQIDSEAIVNNTLTKTFDPEAFLAHDRKDHMTVVVGSFLIVDQIRKSLMNACQQSNTC